MFKNQNILIVSLQPWDIKLGSNSRDIAYELSKNNRVLYVNEPLNSRSKLFRKDSDYVATRMKMLDHKDGGVIRINDGLSVFYPQVTISSINFIPFKGSFNVLNKRNNSLFAKEINKVLAEIGFKDYILFIDSAMFNGFYLKELLNPKTFVYYIRDSLVIQPYFKKHGSRLEPKLIGKADLVATNSDELIEYASKYNQNAINIGQGSDNNLFDYQREDLETPQELIDMKGPVIGYEGFLCAFRLDIKLIEYLAKERPEWQFVFVGPVDEEFAASGLNEISNIHILGRRALQALPDYVNRFDVCINPQLVNHHTWGNNPRKVMEYMAMGKPVVATRTKAMEKFEDICLLADNQADFLSNIESVLKNDSNSKETYRCYAQNNGWEMSMKLLGSALKELKSNII